MSITLFKPYNLVNDPYSHFLKIFKNYENNINSIISEYIYYFVYEFRNKYKIIFRIFDRYKI